MGFLLALLGGELFVFVAFICICVVLGNAVWSALGTILAVIFCIMLGTIALVGLSKAIHTFYRTEDGRLDMLSPLTLVVGIIAFIFGVAGIFVIVDADGVSEYIDKRMVEKEEKLLAKSKCYLSFENLCKTEEIKSIDIKYVYDKKKDKYLGSKWQQIYPSKKSIYTIDKIPYNKTNQLFTVRITTKDITKPPITRSYREHYTYNIIYFGNTTINSYEGIDAQNESSIVFKYDGENIILNNKSDFLKNSEKVTPHTLIHWSSDPKIELKQYPHIYIRSEEDMERGFGNYHSFAPKEDSVYSRSDFFNIPVEYDVFYLEDNKKYYIEYSSGNKKDSKEFIAKDFNSIEIRNNKIYINNEPNFNKFSFLAMEF